ncbi:hypothetical protein GGX14DRAFT_620375, partial [Mycena pura]
MKLRSVYHAWTIPPSCAAARGVAGAGRQRRHGRASKPRAGWCRTAAANNETEPLHAHGNVRQGGGTGRRQAVTAARGVARQRGTSPGSRSGTACVGGGTARGVATRQRSSGRRKRAPALPRCPVSVRGRRRRAGRCNAAAGARCRVAAAAGDSTARGVARRRRQSVRGRWRGTGRCNAAAQARCSAAAARTLPRACAGSGAARGVARRRHRRVARRRQQAGRCKAVGEARYGAAAAAVVESEPAHAPASVHGRWRSMGRC